MTTRLTLLLVTSLIPSLAALAAERPPIIPVTQFFDNPKISSAEISPDGKRFAFLAPEEGRLNVFVGEVGEEFSKARAITHDRQRGIFTFSWTRDGAYVLYEQDQGGNENYHLFRVDPLKPDEAAKDLTPQEGVRAGIISLPREHPDEALISLNIRDKKYFDVYHLQISTAEMRLLDTNPGDVDSWYTDTHGVIRACAAQVAGGKTEIRVRDSGTGPFRTLATYTDEEDASIEGFSPDGTFLFFTDARNSNTTRLVKLDIASARETVIASNPSYDIGSVLISGRTHQLLAVAYDEDRVVYQSFDPQFAKDLAVLQKVHDGEVLLRSSDKDEQKWIVAFNSPTDPGATYLYDRDTGAAKFLYHPRPWLKSDDLVDMKPISFQSRDGLALHGYLSLPKGVEPKDLPTVLVVHGGPWARDDWGYDPETQFLANRGFAVLQINFRGSAGYGKDFLHAGDKE